MHVDTDPIRQQPRLRTAPVQTALESYLREINETPLLTAEDERLLSRRIAEGDPEARDRMVRANLRLVVNMARHYTGKGLGLQDLIAEGNLGLLRAVEGFDASMNTRFSTYAGYWIKQSMRRAVINTAKTIRIPAYVNDLLIKWRRAAAKLQVELDRIPTDEEIATTLKLSKKKLAIIRKAIRICNATPQADDYDGGRPLIETIVDNSLQTPETKSVTQEDLHQVMSLLDQVGRRESAVLRLRFGLDGEGPKTLREIGDRLGLTRERVRQIEQEALSKLSRIVAA
ncbi:MAG: sigma-70 family RNA polymerase sigma factor [Planctomycetota bacterium]|nr:MAG: sigma-70 family RNA polymerase sigma factor [Planctomycetota bacterium]